MNRIYLELTDDEIIAIRQVLEMGANKQPAFNIYLQLIRDTNVSKNLKSIFEKFVGAIQ